MAQMASPPGGPRAPGKPPSAAPRPLPPAWELNQQLNAQGNKSRRPSGWGLVQNPYRSDIRSRKEEEPATPSTTTMIWSYWKHRAVAIIVILLSVVVLAVAFYLITVSYPWPCSRQWSDKRRRIPLAGPIMRHLTQKPETTLVVLATRQDPNLDSKERIFAKPRIHRRVAVEHDACVRSFARCTSTAYLCTRTRGCQPWRPEGHCLAGGARFATMDECRRTCQNGSEPCTVAKACLCRGDYRTANYVHRRGRGCLRIAEHRCLVQPKRGFDTLAHCQHQCGSHGWLSTRCGMTAPTQPCSWKDRWHRVFWDGRTCRRWNVSVCPSNTHPDWPSCRKRCGLMREIRHTAAATQTTTSEHGVPT
ncbi:uncharacterized protein [Dermacentor albipictus]|uniref:uncharacterized protein isoform X2 n=1 Tax=Dermacentor albipictus TaxID=60249 RepID=UPI0038FD0A98